MDVSSTLAALADPRRRTIFELLRKGPVCVRELTDQLPISQPAVSQHLKVLTAADLVTSRPDGARSIYAANPAGLALVRDWIDSMWDDVLDHFEQAAEKEAKS